MLRKSRLSCLCLYLCMSPARICIFLCYFLRPADPAFVTFMDMLVASHFARDHLLKANGLEHRPVVEIEATGVKLP